MKRDEFILKHDYITCILPYYLAQKALRIVEDIVAKLNSVNAC